jgi:hypothetical protein
MKVLNFDKFNSAIFEYDGEEQNTPSKSGIKYKDNMEIKTKDTGKTAARNCRKFGQEAVSAITKMGLYLSAYGNSLNISNSGLKKLRDALDVENPSFANNKKYWEGLRDLANQIYTEGKNHEITDADGKNILDAYISQLAELKKGAEERKNSGETRGEITKTISHEEIKIKSFGEGSEYPDDEYYTKQRSLLKQAYEDQLDKSNILVYNEKMKAAKYYQAAVNAFTQGAMIELEHMETEENAADKNRSYIRSLTQELKNIR